MGYIFKYFLKLDIQAVTKVGLFLILLPFFSSCSFLQKTSSVKRALVIEKKWVRDPKIEDRLGPRLFQRMKPTIAGDKILQGSAHNSLVAYKRSNGSRLWDIKLKYGVTSGVSVYNNSVYFGASDGQFYKLDIESGAIQWTFPVRAETLSTPYISEGVVYFLSGNNVFYALDAETGRVKWQKSYRTVKNLLIRSGSSPVVFGNFIIVGFSNGELISFNKDSGKVLWKKQLSQSKRFPDIIVAPVIDEKYIYVGSYDDSLYKIKVSSGETVWEINSGILNSVTVVEDKLFVATTDGRVLSLDKRSGKTLWSKSLKNGIGTQPVFFNQMLFLGQSKGSLIAMDVNTGKVVASFNPGRGITSPPAIDKKTGELYIQSNEGYLYALRVYWKKLL